MNNLLPFDINKAKAGEPVVTRDGRPARIICFDRAGEKSIVALIKLPDGKELVEFFMVNGMSQPYQLLSDLFHPEPEIWVNVYRWYGNTSHKTGVNTYHSKEEALKNAEHNNPNYVGAYKLVKE